LSTRWNARAATHIIADSEATKTDLTAHYTVPPQKITVAYPGYDESLAPVHDRSKIAATQAHYNIKGDYLLYLGTLQPRKNLSRVITAFADAQIKAQLILAGKRGWLYDDLFSQVQQMELKERVLFPGYIAEEDKAPLLSGALAFVFPSLHEGFGLPVLEAQACGCPVIASTTSSLPEVTGEGGLLVDPRDTTAITRAMERIIHQDDLREGIIKRGLENVRRFSWEKCAQTVMDVILSSPTRNT
jgi:glycosyltransferase involved in cell wall biosynthesis